MIAVPADDELLRRAEKVAAARNTTVPGMLAMALAAISELDFDSTKLSPLTRQAIGLAKGIPDRPYKELLIEALMDAYSVIVASPLAG
jgi:hypothetical protein